MIDYSPFWETLKKSDLNWYRLVNEKHVSRSVLTRIKKGEYISLRVVCDLCGIFHCNLQDICVYVEEPTEKTPNEKARDDKS